MGCSWSHALGALVAFPRAVDPERTYCQLRSLQQHLGERRRVTGPPRRKGSSDRAGEVTGLGEGDLEATCRAGSVYAISSSRPPSEEGATLAHFVDGETESQSCD